MKEELKKIFYDVVILTYRPKEYLLKSLSMLMKQTIIPNKIIIYNTDKSVFDVNIENKDEFNKYIKNDKIEVYHISKDKFDHGKTRNMATTKSKADYILFMTDDACPVDKRLVENLFFVFEDKKVAMCYARQMANGDAPLKEKLVREFNYGNVDLIKDKTTREKYGIKNYFCSNVCCMYDRKIFDKLGGFTEDIILNEDTLYAIKAIENDYKVAYSKDAKVYHSHKYSYMEQFHRNFDIGVSHKQNEVLFNGVNVGNSGMELVKYVEGNLIKRFHFIKAIDFLIECVYRFIGFKVGKRYDTLSNGKCIKYASNKNYFMRGTVR